MIEVRFKLFALWVALMLIYLLGDVLRIFAGDFKAGELQGQKATQAMYLVAGLIMLIPIIMSFLSLTLPQPISRWANIVLAVLLFIFNAIGLPTYPGVYDKFLLAVSLGVNALTVWYAWGWV
jgi:hypothetical protein